MQRCVIVSILSLFVARPAPAQQGPFTVSNWATLPAARPSGVITLDAANDPEGAEHITVYAKRRRAAPGQDAPAAGLALGPARLTGTDSLRQGNQSGMTITAAVPITGVPGLDAVVTAFGGHDAVNTSTTATTAAVTAGIRLNF